MAYNSGQKKTKTKKTKQKKGRKKKTSSVKIVQNQTGRFVQQTSIVNTRDEAEQDRQEEQVVTSNAGAE